MTPHACGRAVSYGDLAAALLGKQFAAPFSGFSKDAPRDMKASYWYAHSALSDKHADLAAKLVASGIRDGGYVLELGSFIGNSATTWARAIKQQKLNASVVCMDT